MDFGRVWALAAQFPAAPVNSTVNNCSLARFSQHLVTDEWGSRAGGQPGGRAVGRAAGGQAPGATHSAAPEIHAILLNTPLNYCDTPLSRQECMDFGRGRWYT
jgi:hypothetical protein